MTDYQELRRLAEQATPGPWHQNHVTKANHRAVMVGAGGHYVYPDQNGNAAYIAAASPDVILRLLDERDIWMDRANRYHRARNKAETDVRVAERWVAALEEALRRIVIVGDMWMQEMTTDWAMQQAIEKARALLQDKDKVTP